MNNNLSGNANGILNLLSANMLQSFIGNGVMNFTQYIALITLLTKNHIPYDTQYTPSNGRDEAAFVVNVYLNPHVSLVFNFSGDSLSTVTSL